MGRFRSVGFGTRAFQQTPRKALGVKTISFPMFPKTAWILPERIALPSVAGILQDRTAFRHHFGCRSLRWLPRPACAWGAACALGGAPGVSKLQRPAGGGWGVWVRRVWVVPPPV